MLVLIEFNELCPRLLDEFMAAGMLPNFKELHDSAVVYTTDAGEEPPYLEPWIQWMTVHTGLPYEEHQAFSLGDGRRVAQKGVAEVLSDAGLPVGVCTSMNTNYGALHGYVIPDPWDKAGVCEPAWLQPFYDTISRHVQGSSRADRTSAREALGLGTFLLRHGVSVRTVKALVSQLWSEKRDPGLRWKRAFVLDQLLYDVFRHLNRRFDVQFASFFSNSTAHFQHYYWRNMEPEHFDAPVPEDDHPSFADAIPNGYRAMDRLIGRMMADYPDAKLVFCTALSQQPWTDTTKVTYRPSQFDTLLEFARVPRDLTVKPVMAEEFHLECPTEEAAVLAETRLSELHVDDEPLMRVMRSGSDLYTGCNISTTTVLDRPVVRASDGDSRRFGELFHKVHTTRSGRHHPDGALWIRDGRRHERVEEHVPLTAVAPTLLAELGVKPPASMRTPPLPVSGDKPPLEGRLLTKHELQPRR